MFPLTDDKTTLYSHLVLHMFVLVYFLSVQIQLTNNYWIVLTFCDHLNVIYAPRINYIYYGLEIRDNCSNDLNR